MKALGKSLLIEFFNCDSKILDDLKGLETILLESARISGATIIKSVFHQFSPHGVSGVVVIAESHFSIHTWPEYNYCAIDIFTCGESIDSDKAAQFLKQALGAQSLSVVDIKRGVLDLPGETLKHKHEVCVDE
jgi:S-adenosylmethionine decarboxylase